MDLREYEQRKFSIAHILRSAIACVPEQTTDLRERVQPLFARLAEDRFNLVVVGRFNRGKTSLMNAILGTDRLPTGIIPLTSVITSVGYGSSETVVLKYQNSWFEKEISIDELPQYVTQVGNPGNIQRIVTAEIRLPAEILRRGFYFVDTPGLGSVIRENTRTTEAFLPEADAFILVTSYESPLSEEEIDFFEMASTANQRTFVVINKHDTVSPEQRETVLRFVRDQLNERSRVAPLLFSVSSIDGLNAKLSGDEPQLRTSGLPALEEELISFLLREKSNEFLRRMCDRTSAFLRELPDSKEVAILTFEIEAMTKQLGTENPSTTATSFSAASPSAPTLHQIETCEVCAKVADRVWDFLCKYQYEVSANSAEQRRLAESGGLCPFHAWQLQSVSSSYGICAGYPALLDQLAASLRNVASETHAEKLRTLVQSLIPSTQECLICRIRNKAEREAIEATSQWLEAHNADAFQELSAICLPHLAALVSELRDDHVIRTLLEHQAAVLQRFSEDMSRYALKYDGRRRSLASKEEERVAERGLLLIAGRRQVNFLPRMLEPKSSGDAHPIDEKSD